MVAEGEDRHVVVRRFGSRPLGEGRLMSDRLGRGSGRRRMARLVPSMTVPAVLAVLPMLPAFLARGRRGCRLATSRGCGLSWRRLRRRRLDRAFGPCWLRGWPAAFAMARATLRGMTATARPAAATASTATAAAPIVPVLVLVG